MNLKIRNMTKEDVGEVFSLEKECFSSPWSLESIEEELGNPQAHFLVAETDGAVAGYIGVQEICGEAYITNVAVTESKRNLGIGSELLSGAIDGAKQRNCAFITLEVRQSNTGAQKLYEKMNFTLAGSRKDFYRNPTENGLIYTLQFDNEEI